MGKQTFYRIPKIITLTQKAAAHLAAKVWICIILQPFLALLCWILLFIDCCLDSTNSLHNIRFSRVSLVFVLQVSAVTNRDVAPRFLDSNLAFSGRLQSAITISASRFGRVRTFRHVDTDRCRGRRAVRISRTKSCVTNWATPTQIMEVLFDERVNSFIFFFQQSASWTVPSRVTDKPPLFPASDRPGLRAFVSSDRKQLRVNNTLARPLALARLRKRADMAVPVWLYARWRQFAIAIEPCIVGQQHDLARGTVCALHPAQINFLPREIFGITSRS